MKDKVSIVISCYNDFSHVETSVNSALKQSYPNKEIIIVDDGSDERTKKVLSEIEPQIDFLITQSNKGPSAARNRGISEATGKYLLILDSDDYFEPTFCEKAVEIFENDQEVKIVSCYARWFWNDRDYQTYKPEGGTIENFLLSNAAVGNSLLRRQDFLNCGGYDEDLKSGYEDWELFIRLLKDGGNAFIIPEILFHYRKRKSSRSYTANSKRYELLEYIYLKHSEVYKKHFEFFVRGWLSATKKSEDFKQQVMNSLDYKIGHKLLKPLRRFGLFKN